MQAIIVATAVLHNIAAVFFRARRKPRVTSEEKAPIQETLFDAENLQDGGNQHNPREARRNKLIN